MLCVRWHDYKYSKGKFDWNESKPQRKMNIGNWINICKSYE